MVDETTPVSKRSARTKRRGSNCDPNGEKRLKRLEEYRIKLTSIIKGVFLFDGKANVAGDNFSFAKQLATLYKKIKNTDPNDLTDGFYSELRFRLNFMVGDTQVDEGRRRVFIFFASFARRMYSTQNDDRLFSFIVTYCVKLYCAVDTIVRQNVCCFVGIIFKQWRQLLFKNHDESERELTKARNQLYDILDRRHLDKDAAVRAEVYQGMAALQDVDIPSDFKVTKSPTEFIMMGFRDTDASCRILALQSIDLSVDNPVVVEAVADVATFEDSTKVRKEAILQMSKVDPKRVDSDQLTVLLHTNLTATEDLLQKFTMDRLLSVWLAMIAQKITKRSASNSSDSGSASGVGLGAAMMLLINRLNWQKYPKGMGAVCLAAIDTIHRILSAEEPVTLSSVIKSLAEDQTQPRLLTRCNKNDLINADQSIGNMASKAFLWRHFVQYCYDKTGTKNTGNKRVNELERDECLTRLAPTLYEMAVLVENVVKFESEYPSENPQEVDAEYREMAILDCLDMCTYLEKEAAGMNKWRDVLENIMLESRPSKTISDHIARVLVKYHYREDPLDILVSLVNRLAEAVHREYDPNATANMNQTISLPTGNEDRAPSPALVLSDELTLHKIQIVVSLLKTGKFLQMNPYLKDIFSTLVPACFRLDNLEARTWALESTAIMCGMDLKMATGCFSLAWKALVSDDVVESRMSSMDGVCDLVIQYHYSQVKNWIDNEEITDLFRDILKDPNVDDRMCMKTLECSAKMLLAEAKDCTEYNWIELLAALIGRSFHKNKSGCCRQRSCATQFLLLFSSMSRSNQKLLCNALTNLLHEIVYNPNDEFLGNVKYEMALNCILELTRENRLVKKIRRSFSFDNESNKENNANEAPRDSTAHVVLFDGLVGMISDVVDSDGGFLKLFCRAIQNLDLDDSEPALIDHNLAIIKGFEDLDKKANEELTKLVKRLVALKKIVEKEKEEENDDVAPLPLKTPAPKRRGRALKAIKCDSTLLMTPEGSSSPVVKQELSTRTRLPRTAKKTCAYHE